MADQKYLKLHRRTWIFQTRVPVDLVAQMGKTIYTKSLRTGDLRVAQRRRAEVLAELEALYRNLRQQPDWLTPSGITSAARRDRAAIEVGACPRAEVLEGWDLSIFHEAQDNDPAGLTLPDDARSAAMLRGRRIVEGHESASIPVSEALERHLKALAKTARPSTCNARHRRVAVLVEALNDPPIADVDRKALARFVGGLNGAIKTRRDSVSDIRAFFGWCQDAGLTETNPADRLSRLIRESTRGIQDEAQRRPWTDAELKILFQHIDNLKPNDYLRKLIPIALYSGMRLNEICELQGKDIVENCFVIREAKNKNSLRSVPIHTKIAPLTQNIKANEYLIPSLKPGGQDNKRGHEASKRFGRYKSKWAFGKELVFHGFRASFISRLENAAVPVNICESIVGHARQSMSYGTYSKGADMPVLREAIEKVKYNY